MWSLKSLTIIKPSFLELQIIYTLIIWQITQVFCNSATDMQESIIRLEKIFGYDFNTLGEIGHVLIWKISGNQEPFTPLQYNGDNVQFGSDETYLVFAEKPLDLFMIYYWLGGNTSLIDKKMVARYAVLLTLHPKIIRNSCVKKIVSRETEGMESDSFQNTLKMLYKHAGVLEKYTDFSYYLDKHLPSPRPNLYVIQGKRHSRIKKIPLSLGVPWLMNKYACLVLEMESKACDMFPIIFYCGAEAYIIKILRSQFFAKEFSDYFTGSLNSIPYGINNHSDFKQFLEVLEDRRFYNPNEIDNSRDYLKNPAQFIISRDLGYLLDTKSVAGVFLILNDSNKYDPKFQIHGKIKAIQIAEEFLEKTYPLSSGQIMKMRIGTTQPISSMIDLEINFPDFPTLPNDEFSDFSDDEQW